MSNSVVIYCIVVLAFFCLFQAVSMMMGEAPPENTLSLRRKAPVDRVWPWLANILVARHIRNFELMVTTSGMSYSPGQVLAAMAVAISAIMLAMNLARFSLLWCVAAGVVLGAALPALVIRQMRRRRMRKLIEQLPDALDMMTRSLRVGHPVSIGIKTIGTEMADPVGSEFKRVFDAMSYGLDLKDSLEILSARLQLPQVSYLIAAIRIQNATGGNLADVLTSLSNVMRERVRLNMKVMALSAESRLSAYIMAVVPFLLIAAMFLTRSDLYNEILGSFFLQLVLAGAGVLLLIGIVLMQFIVNIRA